MALRENDATFARLIFRPDNGCVPRVPSKLLDENLPRQLAQSGSTVLTLYRNNAKGVST
jgi:hypothetical protein